MSSPMPSFSLFDGDSTRGERDQAMSLNRRLLRLAGAAEVEFPASQMNATSATFGFDLEAGLQAVDPQFSLIRE